MTSIVQGYEYDIFISYRQKDNKGERWVSEFVDALKTELESTFKEEIRVYFDINPHDGLLETHDVDASLRDKLKCLVFIPIISRTYCDPKSFAWEHEFRAFVEQASQDQFGLKVKLPNGNVASRVIPIRIHELDAEDIKLCESVLGGVLRGIDFIYKESGIDKPLTADDDEKKNLNNTKYRIQIVKVAHAIREIITAIGQPISQKEEVQKEVLKPISVPKKNNRIKIIIATVVVLALIMFGYFLIPKFSKPKEQLEKSIAVLPFINDSPDQENTYFINGIMEEVLNNLQKIKDFRVLSRTSTDQYKGSNKPTIPEIAKTLGVNYIVEGSGQKYGNSYRLRVQLIIGKKERHLWAESYEKEIKETKDIFGTQSNIAQSIASALKATITPEEKQLINKIPTTNLTAYDFYQQGREEYAKGSLKKAEDLYHKALKCDSAFAQAYSGLAFIYWDKHVWNKKEFLSENFGDSLLILANIALSFDDQLSEPYLLKGRYYNDNGKPEQAIEEIDKAIKLNPNDWMAYREKGGFYGSNADFLNWINYLQKAISVNRGAELPSLLWGIGWAYFQAGFTEKAKQFYQDKLKLDGDSITYYDGLVNNEFWLANFNKSIEYGEKGYSIDSTSEDIVYMLGMSYEWLGQYEESLKYYKKWFEILKTKREISIQQMSGLGYAYLKNGDKEKAEYCFNETINNCNRLIELKRSYKPFAYYDLAGAYASKGDKGKAFANLRILNQIQRIPFWQAVLIKTDPLLNNIRNEPEFQQIAKDIEAKYQAEHERVRKWLEGNKML